MLQESALWVESTAANIKLDLDVAEYVNNGDLQAWLLWA